MAPKSSPGMHHDRPGASGGSASTGATKLASLFLMIFLFAPGAAHAYIDPGLGSLLWQAALSGLFGVMFYSRQIWRWMNVRLRRTRTEDARSPDTR